jgi:hypothetical protein
MAYVALDNGEVSNLSRKDFTVVSDDSGHLTLVIPRISLRVHSEESSDILVNFLLEVLETWEMLS